MNTDAAAQAAELNAASAALSEDAVRTVAGRVVLGIDCYGDLVKRFNREMAWQLACQRYEAGKLLGSTFYNPEPKGLPSKPHKHHMYADASRLISILSLDVPHPTTLPMVADVIAAAAAKFMAGVLDPRRYAG